MATYTLNVLVDDVQVTWLKDNKYSLCIAKQCETLPNDSELQPKQPKQSDTPYTVVWKGDKDFIHTNMYQWTEEYQVFGSQTFKVSHVCHLED